MRTPWRRWATLGASSLLVAAGLGAGCGDDTATDTTDGGGVEAGEAGGNTDGSTSSDAPISSDVAVDAPIVPSTFGLDTRPSNPTCVAPARPVNTAAVRFERVFPALGLDTPLMLAQIPGDASRWFAALRDGRVVSFPSTGNPTTTTVLDLRANPAFSRIDTEGEGGLLGLAFSPKFAQNGRLYVTFTKYKNWDLGTNTRTQMQSVVSRLVSTDGGATFANEKEVLGPFDQPVATNHKGGGIAFGPDGMLYLSFGDGGGGGDTYDNGQNKNGFFSKVLRIDADGVPDTGTYTIPDGNPFKNGGGEPATFARGFRNPFRFSFDRGSGDLWLADVGQAAFEEIDKVTLGGNYGWPMEEGSACFKYPVPADCAYVRSLIPMIHPVFEYAHPPASSVSVTGGIVYRGSAVAGFQGSYVFADFGLQTIWRLVADPTTGAYASELLNGAGPAANIVSFAEDNASELYAVAISGEIYKLVQSIGAEPSTAPPFPATLSATGCVDAADAKKTAPGVLPYGVISELWSDGASKERFMALPDGTKITVLPDGDWDFPNGTVLMKTFSVGGKRIETRLFVRHSDGQWAGYSYEWNDAQTDAMLLPSTKVKALAGGQPYTFPSRADCVTCHTAAAGRSLGLETQQLNSDQVYLSTRRISNQLRTLDHIGMFAAPIGEPAQLPKIPDPFGTEPLESRARSYLHANCSNCHRTGSTGGGSMDWRYQTPFYASKSCNVPVVNGDFDVTNAKVIAPGSLALSMVSLRTHALDAKRMPPIATRVVDVKGTTLVDQWITSLTSCPTAPVDAGNDGD